MARPFILCIGGATQDVFIRSHALEEHHDDTSPDGIAACFLMGSKMAIDELTFASGGGATNAAVTFARFGFKTACIIRLGKDQIGGQILEDLKREKIETGFVQTDPKEKTAYSVILLSGTGHRAIFTHRGASQKLDASAFPWHHWSKRLGRGKIGDWIYLTSLGGDLRALKDIFEHAKRSKTKIAWNPGNMELKKGLKTLKPFIEQCEIFSVNKEEADVLGGWNALASLPGGAFLMTMGQQGAMVRGGKKTWRANALKARRVNTTGAGDAFGSAFTAAWIKTGDVRMSFAAAMLNAT
ncbi:MAG TPA: carbohydrate kinase family protein, partial [Verrucomicrobiae bacterium]|nr:carbohydrate kinase family protein [Verrucomicrobiae bacterium]